MSAPASRMWARVSPILDELLERPEAEWAGLVEQRCGGDEELRREVLRLLSAHAHAGGFLSQPAFDLAPTITDQAASAAEPERAAPASAGPWRVVRELGRGGMGVVYLAERAGEQFRQRAALKLVRTGLDSEEVLARFHRERRILASLDHPHIARLLDGGRSEDGRPYLAMEYVEGQPLTAYCRERALGVEERLRLFLSICKAVQHAHSRLVVHRDLKPSNILVTGTGEPRLLDFGIAKLLAEEEGDRALTRTGLSVMTPDYAAPEQLRHEPVSTATDVYALGVILYELLAGRHPFRDRPSGAGDGTARPEPPAPSTVCEDKTLRRRLAGDLDTIVRMALRDEPARRYASAEALGRDIDRHLAGLPVSARPDTVGYRTRKFVRRHRLAVAAAAALTLTAGSALLALSYALSAARGRLAEAERAEAIQSFLVDTLGEADPARARGHETTVREALDRGAARLPTALTRQPRTRAELLRTMGALYHALGHDDRATPLLAEALRLADAEYGPGSVEVGRVLLEKADTHYWYDSNQEAALADWKRALGIFRAAPADHRREVATALDGIGLVQRELGRYEEAEKSHREALAVARAVQGGDSPDVAKKLTSLANTLHRAGREEEAMVAAADAVRIYRAGGESVRPDLADALEKLGLALAGGGRLAEAEAPLRESLALRRRIYGQEHPVVLEGVNSWASLLEKQGRIAEALPMRRDALEVARRVLVPGGDLAVHVNNLALLCYRSGDWACAEAGFREALGLWRISYGERHIHVASGHNNLGMSLLEQGKLANAEDELRAALELRRALAGEESAEVAQSSRNLGLAQLRQGRLGQARADLDRAVELSRRVYAPRHPRLAEALMARADLALAEKRRQDAVRDLEEALAIREEKLGGDNPLTAKARAELERARGGRVTGRP